MMTETVFEILDARTWAKEICRDAEHKNWAVPTTPPLLPFHQHSCYIVTLLLATVLLALPNRPDAWKIIFLVPFRRGSATLREFTVLFRAQNAPLPTPEKLSGSWVGNVLNLNYVSRSGSRDRLNMWQLCLLCPSLFTSRPPPPPKVLTVQVSLISRQIYLAWTVPPFSYRWSSEAASLLDFGFSRRWEWRCCSSGFFMQCRFAGRYHLKMETVCFSETLVSTYESTRRQDPEEQHRQDFIA
jgi:hypothetical protein